MRKVVDDYLRIRLPVECTVVTIFPGINGNASYATGQLTYKAAEKGTGGLQDMKPERMTGELTWYFDNRQTSQTPESTRFGQPFDMSATDILVLTLFGGSDDQLGQLGSFFNPKWQQQFPDGIGLRLLHEEVDPGHAKDLILGMDANGAGLVIGLYRL